MDTLGHLSDWHTTPVAGAAVGDLLGKRASGWLSWHLKRHKRHLPEVLDALIADVRQRSPDQVVITGDLTNIALEQEFVRAREQLHELGAPNWVSLIPGNHDAYVAVEASRSWDYWAPYLRGDPRHGHGDPSGGSGPASNGLDAAGGDPERAPRIDDYPTLRVRGGLALVGLCSAIPTPVFRATGRLGEAQIERLDALLGELRGSGLCRVVLVHHSPVDDISSPRRRLLDSSALREVVARQGAELILHGHCHRTVAVAIEGADGPVPVIGVRSSSYTAAKASKRAQYHVYHVQPKGSPGSRAGFDIRVEVRGYDAVTGCVAAEDDLPLPIG